MKNNLYIITGGSNGFGRSLVLNLLNENHTVISISRSSLEKAENLFQIKTDFSKTFAQKTEKSLNSILLKIKNKKFDQVILINNAAVVHPVARIEKLKEKDIQKHMQINLNAPISMTQIFLNIFEKKKAQKIVVQITSGAAVSAVEGWAAYCAGKAGLNMFNQVLALQFAKDANFKAIGYSPGIMDTNMQKNIRAVSAKDFPNVNEFKSYKTENKLRSTDYVANDLIKVISDFSKIETGAIYRVS